MKCEESRLGVQTNKGLVKAMAHWKCGVWKPKKAKSYNMRYEHTDYHKIPQDHETGYATVYVEYFTTAKEGTFLLSEIPPICPLLWEGTIQGMHGEPWPIPQRKNNDLLPASR